MGDYYNEEYYFEDKITTIEKFKLASFFSCYDDYGEAETFYYEIKVKEVFNNDGIITIQK